MSRLLIHPSAADADGRIHAVTRRAPVALCRLRGLPPRPGRAPARTIPEGREAASCSSPARRDRRNGTNLGKLGSRRSPFEGSPGPSICRRTAVDIEAEMMVGIALGIRAGGGRPAAAGDLAGLRRPGDRAHRHQHHPLCPQILPRARRRKPVVVDGGSPPGGHWSYTPRTARHADFRARLSRETYYHRLARPGSRLQARYTDDRASRDDGRRRPRRRAGAARLSSRRRAARVRFVLPECDGGPNAPGVSGSIRTRGGCWADSLSLDRSMTLPFSLRPQRISFRTSALPALPWLKHRRLEP